jgi:hypothetical protein
VTNSIPALQARWTIESDDDGFQMTVKDVSFAQLDAMMQHGFGIPRVSEDVNLEGQPHRVWGASEIGVAIQLIGRPGGSDILCLRGM